MQWAGSTVPGRRILRLAHHASRLALTASLVLVASVYFGAPSFAQKSEVAALNARITELNRAGKYSEAIPQAERLVAILEKAHGPVDPDVAAALNNLARSMATRAATPRPSRCTGDRWRCWRRCMAWTTRR
jgi:hypothetical protein